MVVTVATGVYNGIIAVTQAGASNSPVNVPVVLVVNGGGSGGGGGTLTFSPAAPVRTPYRTIAAIPPMAPVG